MSMTTENTFIDNIWICPICHEKLDDPYLTPCEHLVCRKCLTEENQINCPVCHEKLSNSDIRPAPLTVRNLLERRRVICVHCGQNEIPAENLDEHYQQLCPKMILSCPAAHVNCSWRGSRDALDTHLIACSLYSVHLMFNQLKSENQHLANEVKQFEDLYKSQYQSRIHDIQNIRDNQTINGLEFSEQLAKEDAKIQVNHVEIIQQKYQIGSLEEQVTLLRSELHHSQQERKRLHQLLNEHENQLNQLNKKQKILTGMIGHHNESLVERISQCQQRMMKLNEQKITDRDLFIVVQHAIINDPCEILDLQSNEITANGIEILADALQNNTTLNVLLLHENRLADSGVSHLAKALSSNKTPLITLDLESNGITDEGVSSLAQMLRTNTTLKNLYLSDNQISDRGIQYLAEVLTNQNQTLEELVLDKNLLITDTSVQALMLILERNSSLKTLRLWNCQLSEESKAILSGIALSKDNFSLIC